MVMRIPISRIARHERAYVRIRLGTRSPQRALSYRQGSKTSRALILMATAAIGSSFTVMTLPWAPAHADTDTHPVTTVSVAPGEGYLSSDSAPVEASASLPSDSAHKVSASPAPATQQVSASRLVLDSSSRLAQKFARTPYDRAEIVVEGAEFAPEEQLPNQTPAQSLEELDPQPSTQNSPSIEELHGHNGQMWVGTDATPSANATSIGEIQRLNSIPAIDSSLATPEVNVASGEIRRMTFELNNVGHDVRELEIEGVFSSKAPGTNTLTWTLECTATGGATCPNFAETRTSTFTTDKEVPLFHSVVNMPRDSRISITAEIRQTVSACVPHSLSETTTKFLWKRLSADVTKQTELELSGQVSCPETTATPTPSVSASPTPSASPSASVTAKPSASPTATERPSTSASPTTHAHVGHVIVQPRPRQTSNHVTPTPARAVRVYSPQSPNRPSARNAVRRTTVTSPNRTPTSQQSNTRTTQQRSTSAPILPTNPSIATDRSTTPASAAPSAPTQVAAGDGPSSYAFNADGRRGGLMSDVEANSAVAVAALLVTAAAGALATFHKGK